MAVTVSTTGHVTSLTIVDSDCVEVNGTYDLIFTGDNTTPATGTYTIASNVITAVTLTGHGSGYASAPTVATQTSDGGITATLASLSTAQESQTRRPLISITSSQREADIPFDGSFLTTETFDEFGPNLLGHSTGRLCKAYAYHEVTEGSWWYRNGLKYAYTDLDRREWTIVTIQLQYYFNNYPTLCVSLCELTDGNIGLVYIEDIGATRYMRYRIITVTGSAVSNGTITSWADSTYYSNVWVQTLGENSYAVFYAHFDDPNYYIYKRTSADFTSWSAESQLSIGGITTTYRIANPSILEISTGDLWLWFDALESTGGGGEELTNIYYSVSSDTGATWSNATKVTSYDTYSEVGNHPVAVQKLAGTMHMIFNRVVGALHADEDTTGWPTGDAAGSLSWDSVNRKLYVCNGGGYYGTRSFYCVVKIDVDTWTVEDYWDTSSTPAVPTWLGLNSWLGYVQDAEHIVFKNSSSPRAVFHLDGEADTLTAYYLDDSAGDGVTANVDQDSISDLTSNNVSYLQMDVANDRIWLSTYDTYARHAEFTLGYFDTTESEPYTYNHLFTYETSEGTVRSLNGMYVDVDGGYAVFTGGANVLSYGGHCWVFDLETGAEIVSWDTDDNDLPHYGLTAPFVYNGRIYAGMAEYTSGYSQESFRGLVEIDISSETITLHRPSYCSDDNHYFGRPYHLQDGKLAMTHNGYGVAVFDTVSQTWELFSNDNIPGFTTNGVDLSAQSQIVYDDTNDLIMVGDAADKGVIMFSYNGYIRRGYYAEGTLSGTWSFGTPEQLTQGYLDYDCGACIDPGDSNSMYVAWTNEDTEAEQSIKWDKDGSTVDISSYLLDEEITETKTISGNPASLTFQVSHGHLFDPYNLSSLLSPVLKKGRKLSLRWGEKIDGISYWQESGEYFVTETSMSLKRGDYPSMSVKAEDQRALWQHGHIYATAAYNNLPSYILQDVLEDQVNMASGDIDMPSFSGATNLNAQWMDATPEDILTQVCERLGYYFRFTNEGKASARQISNVAAADHVYSNNKTVISYSPDDRYSDFTNRVTVQGQELEYTQVYYEEERITQLSGTLGWWGCRDEHIVWFSDDKSRRCINPRLNAIETSTSIPFKLAGSVTESITECGALDDYKFCTVNISAPNLIPVLAAAIATWGTSMSIGNYAPFGCGLTVSVGRWIEKAGLFASLMTLGSVANYQLEVWAQPLGSIRRSVQGTWNDTEHQTEINAVVEQVIEDPLCYSAADCNAVANFEGMVVQMQRKRIKIEKVAHLQDEDGDTIQVVHPYGGSTMTLYVASLKRKYKKGAYFLDEIEGWVCS